MHHCNFGYVQWVERIPKAANEARPHVMRASFLEYRTPKYIYCCASKFISSSTSRKKAHRDLAIAALNSSVQTHLALARNFSLPVHVPTMLHPRAHPPSCVRKDGWILFLEVRTAWRVRRKAYMY